MRRLTLASFALILMMGAKCRREESSSPTGDASVDDASVVDGSASIVDAATKADAPAKDPFRRFDPASSILHTARNAGGLSVNGVKPEPLSADQEKKAAALKKTLEDSDTQPAAEITALRDEVVAGVRAGRLDDAKLRARRADVVKAIGPVFDVEVEALNELHALLTPDQRRYVTTTTQWGRPRSLRISGHVTTTMLRDWTKPLALDDAKKKKVEAALPAPELLADSFDGRMRTVMASFERDTFDAKSLDILDPKKKAVLPLDVETDFVRKVLPLLDANARNALAEQIEREDLKRFRD